MNIAVLGRDSAIRREVLRELEAQGIAVSAQAGAVICLYPEAVDEALRMNGLQRLVLRSHAFVYGSSDKNPGLLTEERISLLHPKAPEQKWLEAETRAQNFSNTAILRLTNVLDPDEGDVAVRQLARKIGFSIGGRDPNLQFLTVKDAARALVSAATSQATGIFNIAGDGTIPLKKAFRAAGVERISIPGSLKMQPLLYNWTVSSERAARELGFHAEKSTLEALKEFVSTKPGARPELLDRRYDDFGLDVDYIRAWGGWFSFLRNTYWRIEYEGMENIPQTGRAMFVSNHRGFMPLDAVMHLSNVFTHRGRVIRFLILPSLLRTPYLCNFLVKLGGVIANQVNANRLFEAEELVGLFPEGIRGTFQPYKQTHRLRDFAKSAFAKMAIENRAPIIPCAVIGHSEIFPIIGRIDSGLVVKTLGWPYLPIAPMFPLAPVPLPSKWHIRILKPVPLDGLSPADAENQKLLNEFSRHIQRIVQMNIDDMVPKRKSIFWGKVLDGTAPEAPAFRRTEAAGAR